MLNEPEVVKRGEHLRAYLRGDGSSLMRPIIELAMTVTARENNCQFIWNAHAASVRRADLSDAVVDALRDKRDLYTAIGGVVLLVGVVYPKIAASWAAYTGFF